MTNKKQGEALSFNGLGIAPKLLDILTQSGFTTPTPIQVKSIPISLQGKDLVGIAQTGTGKTLAFGIPMLQILATQKGKGLVVLPTRELAIQVEDNLMEIGKKIGLKTVVLIGGQPIERQLTSLKRNPHVIIATPGRLVDHISRRSVSLKEVKVLVLDEADMMLDMGFLPQIREILKSVPKQRQTMLFSATMPTEIMKIAAEHMALPVRIEVAPAGTSAENVEQEIIIMARESKYPQLKKILSETEGSVLIFARTKHSVKKLTKKVEQDGFSAAEIHSNRSLAQRQQALTGFKQGKYRVLIATDIAARGIDVKDIQLVINYDLPEKSGDYVHRIGRTARAGKSGKAISFVLPEQANDLRDIEKLINKTLNKTKVYADPNAPKEEFVIDDRRGRGMRGGVGARRPIQSNSRPSSFGARRQTSSSPSYSPSTSGGAVTKYKSFGQNKPKSSSSTYTKSPGSRKPFVNNNRPQRTLTDREKFLKSMSGGERR